MGVEGEEELVKSGPNQDLVDKWTPVHFLSGMVAGWMGVPLPMFLISFAGFEALEYAVMKKGEGGPESFTNVAGDLAAASLGYAVAVNRKSLVSKE